MPLENLKSMEVLKGTKILVDTKTDFTGIILDCIPTWLWEVIKTCSDRASWSIFCEMHSSNFHWQSALCQASQNPQQDRGKLTHTNCGAVESISDILSVTNRCFVNKTCMYKCPQNVLTRSVVTAKDNSCHHAMSYQITAERLFFHVVNSRTLTTNKSSYLQRNSKCKGFCTTRAAEHWLWGADREIILSSWKW